MLATQPLIAKWSPEDWTAFGAMLTASATLLIAAVAIGVGIAEWKRSNRERKEAYQESVDLLTLEIEDGALVLAASIGRTTNGPRQMQRWTMTVTNDSKRTFRNCAILVRYAHDQEYDDPQLQELAQTHHLHLLRRGGVEHLITDAEASDPPIMDILKMADEPEPSFKHVTVPTLRPGENVTVNTPRTEYVMDAWLLVPHQTDDTKPLTTVKYSN